MNSIIYKYPLDYDGNNPQNSVSIPIKLATGNANRAEALPLGPMFADTVRVTEASKPNTALSRGKDYQLIISNPDLSKRCRGRDIVHAIVVFNEKVSDRIVVGGQIVGGPYGSNLDAIEQLVDAIKADTRKVKWSDLRQVPSEFVAAPAYYDVGDIYGFEYIVMALGQLESAIRLKDNAEMVRIQQMIQSMRSELIAMFKTHIDQEGNVHKVTRAQLNVYSTAQVDNIFTEALNRFNTLVTELGKLDNVDKTLASRIDGVVTSTANYITQIVDSNLEHQKNTLEIARVSEGLAQANRRINDANTAIQTNVNAITNLQSSLQSLSRSVSDEVNRLDARITTLTNNVNNALQDIERRLGEIESKKLGETYIQFPGTAAPGDLFGGRWRLLFNDESVFFRTEGNDASNFGGGVQGDAMRNLTGMFTVGTTTPHSVAGFSGVFAGGGTGRADTRGATVNSHHHNRTSFNAARQVPVAGEFRPKNRTFRIWQRY